MSTIGTLATTLTFVASGVAENAPAKAPQPATPAPTAAAAKKIDFETQILPVFKKNCLSCHNATDAEGDLVLETPATIAKGGEDGPVVVPHKGAESLLVKSAARDAKPYMPPKTNKVGAENLTPAELALLQAWIDEGATGTVTAKAKPVKWRPLPPGLHPILALAVAPDGQYAACGRANQIFIYHVPTGQTVARLADPKLDDKSGRSGWRSSAQRDFVQSLVFSPDGRMLASGEYRMVKLWRREPNLPQFTLGAEPATALALSPDGKLIATAAKDNVIRIWDSAAGKQVKELPGSSAAVNALRFSPDNKRLVSGGADKTLRVWDLATGQTTTQVEAANEITAVAWVRDGKQLASAGGDNSVRLWDIPAAAGSPLTQAKELTGHSKPITALVASADGKQLFSGSEDGSIRQWATDSAKQVRQFDNGAPVASVALSPNGKTLAAAGGNHARIWNTEKGQQLGEMKGDHRAVYRLDHATQFAEFAKTEVAYWKDTMDAANKTQTAKADALKKATDAVPSSEKTLADAKAALEKVTDDKAKPAAEDAVKKAETAKSSAEKALKLAQEAAKQATQSVTDAKASSDKAVTAQQAADAEVEKAKKAVTDAEKSIRAVAFSPDGLTVATAGEDQIVHTWSAENGAGFDTFPSQLGSVQALAYATDGRIISAAEKNGAIVWRNGPTWTLARTIGTGDEKSPLINRVVALDFSPDSQIIATGGGMPSRSGEVKLWRTSDGGLVREISPSHSDTVFGVAFSPDGKLLATAGADKFVKVFDVGSGKQVKQLSGHTHYVLSVSWRADGRELASSGADKTVKLWTYPSGEQTKSIEDFKKEVTSVRFVGYSVNLLTASGDDRVRMLKHDGNNLQDYRGGKGFIFSTAITPDGRTILGGGQDSVLRAWNAASGKNLFSLDPPPVEAPQKSTSASAAK